MKFISETSNIPSGPKFPPPPILSCNTIISDGICPPVMLSSSRELSSDGRRDKRSDIFRSEGSMDSTPSSEVTAAKSVVSSTMSGVPAGVGVECIAGREDSNAVVVSGGGKENNGGITGEVTRGIVGRLPTGAEESTTGREGRGTNGDINMGEGMPGISGKERDEVVWGLGFEGSIKSLLMVEDELNRGIGSKESKGMGEEAIGIVGYWREETMEDGILSVTSRVEDTGIEIEGKGNNVATWTEEEIGGMRSDGVVMLDGVSPIEGIGGSDFVEMEGGLHEVGFEDESSATEGMVGMTGGLAEERIKMSG